MTEARIASLEATGFEWKRHGKFNSNTYKSFKEILQDLKTFKEEHGHLNIQCADNQSLSDFCSNVRSARNNPEKGKMKLTEGRRAYLDAIGFNWNLGRCRRANTA